MRGKVKLSDDDVREIRGRREAGAKIATLAALYGVHKNTISTIVRGLSRKDVK
jgi:predicted transcriptional regulator